MRAGSYKKRNKDKKYFYSFFEKSIISRISKSSGFCKRKSKKIKPIDFIVGFFVMSLKGLNTYSCWAEQIGLLCNKAISKQAIFVRIQSSTVVFVKELLQERLGKSYQYEKTHELFSFFKKVFLHDSTTLSLADNLVKSYPGNCSNGKQTALARIQAIYDFKQKCFSCFKLTAYTNNDQSASGLILEYLKKGDLVVRDLGFFVLDVFSEIIKKEAYFLSRSRFGVNLHSVNSEIKINISDILKKKKNIDMDVLIGEKQRLKIRLVVRKLPEHIGAERRRKARKDRDKRLNHSKAYYQLLGYGIFITNVEKELWTAKDVENAYGVRWQIEIIFKSWKSHFNIQKIIHKQCRKKIRVECIIYLMLLFITLFQTRLYNYFKKRIRKKFQKDVSLLKLAKFIANHIDQIIELTKLSEIEKQIYKHCCFETRNDRVNAAQKYENNYY